ncbi:hypothetical protein GYMLUDRAFT_72083 [Collybiopsis luxurians FD-317 M1]|uniref:Unplaced genomic scaffold GYMLUscaffold_16, whole genome shotgun sequence n=1 Tax=Collybiopsis luxurians FD-317 M1 TaxID=944289 RepID=A0A0D0D2F5_9AGAR|nr:hypothetical protein GYMLUDRAFT_72083 [Collybiopsis luxurians FD-317 M1]
MDKLSNTLWGTTSAVGAGLCLLVFVIIIVVWLHPESRPCFDRVSFRIVTVALIANMTFAISSSVAGLTIHDGFMCGFSIFVLQSSQQISSLLVLCVALNLQLVVVNGVNGRNMEKFYFIFSFLLSAALVIPPYAANQYGWDPLEHVCWYKNDNLKERLVWQIGTQMAWTGLAAVAEIGISISVLLFLLSHHVRMHRIFVSTSTSISPQVIHSNSFRLIILRIGLYPIASCFVNLLTVFTALHSTISNGIHSRADYDILLLSDALYGIRPIVYALLAASDPALVRGVKTLYKVFRGTHIPDSSIGKPSTQNQSNAVVVHIELATFQDHGPVESHSQGEAKLGSVDHKNQPAAEETPPDFSRVRGSFQRRDDGPENGGDSQVWEVLRREEAMKQEMAALNRQI